MRHPGLRAALFTTALGASAAAHANAGIGFFTPASIMLVLGVIPVILVEGPILAWRLGVRMGRGLYLSLGANLVSTLAGAVLGLALDFAVGMGTGMMGSAGREGFILALALMFGITLWIEHRVLRRAQAATPRGVVFRAALLANVVSYALLIAVAIMTIERDPMIPRAQMSEVLAAMSAVRMDLTEHYQAHGSFPAPLRQDAPVKRVGRLWTEESGRIVAEVANTGRPELDGRRVVYEPQVRDGKIVAWHCYVPEAPHKFFPAACRFASPPR